MTRRAALRAAGMVGLSAMVGATLPAHLGLRPSWLKRSSYSGLHHGFRAMFAGTRTWVKLSLRSISDLPAAQNIVALRDHDDAFALTFEGPPGGGQGTHMLSHPVLGTFSLFVTRAAAPSGSERYEAVINRAYA